jgi:hypothetical protein
MAKKVEARTVGADPSLETNRDRTAVDSEPESDGQGGAV